MYANRTKNGHRGETDEKNSYICSLFIPFETMTKEDVRIVFMGTPDFAVESLRALVEGGYQVVGVITMPDKPVGRHGSALQASAVKQYAVSVGLPVLQPEKLKDEAFLREFRDLQADLQIVVAFRMLPEAVWAMPRFGTFNLHASLLPQYRGAAPINRAIINGEKETGATTFFLTHEIDTGKIIRQEKLAIAETDDAGTVHDALMRIGAKLVAKTVDLIIESNENIDTIPQETLYENVTELHPAPKIFKDTCRINWEQTTEEVYNFIRGLSPYPAAWTEFILPAGDRVSVKIFQSEKRHEAHSLPPGTIRTAGKQSIEIATRDGFLQIHSLQLSGKKRMSAKEFLNGHHALRAN
jgi:methionyl-tRNA formyltransferase